MRRSLDDFHPPVRSSVIDQMKTDQRESGFFESLPRKMQDPLDRRIGIKTPAVLIPNDNQEEIEDQGFMGELLKIPSVKETVIDD